MHPASAILLDIEGTTTPLAFVTEVLFPYAREHVREYLSSNLTAPGVREEVAQLVRLLEQERPKGLLTPEGEIEPEADHVDSIVQYIFWLMDRDSKSTPLKSIQGRIWREGYARGELKSIVYEDVAPAFAGWNRTGKTVAIYSSGSVEAQKLLFSHTNAGDLTRFINAYFDTNVGSKLRAGSYAGIAKNLKLDPGDVLFISDITAELDAAGESGLQTLLCVRKGNRPQEPGNHRVTTSFEELEL
ncbi:MAG: acireductone synthase [Blastocatellia bacterium]